MIASSWRRILAYWLDSVLLGICLLPFWIQIWGALAAGGPVAVDLRWLMAVLLLQLFYKWSFLYFLGGTLGKLVMGLRVVPHAKPREGLGLFQSFLRVVTDSLSIFFGVAPRALVLLRLDRTHISDWVAETQVVQVVKQERPMRRHWALALVVIWISFYSQFSSLYRYMHWIELKKGQIIFNADIF